MRRFSFPFALLMLVSIGFLGLDPAEEARVPASEVANPRELLTLVEGYGHAVATNNRELALWYVHPRAPARFELDTKLRRQLASYLQRTRVIQLEEFLLPDGTPAAAVDHETLRVMELKFTRRPCRSIYPFRKLGEAWRISAIGECSG